jgi:hypothetical protein
MKKIFALLIILISINVFGQQKYDYYSGQRFIRKAEKNISKGKFERALKLLSKAEQSTFGFCGSGSYSTLKNIERLKVDSFLGLKKYDSILSLLDNKELFFEFEAKKDDSLKVQILFLKFGKENVINSFKKSTKLLRKTSIYNDFFNYTLFLEDINYTFSFKKVNNKYNKIEFDNETNFKSISKNTLFYNLIFVVPK